jgi:hypothetical protein
MDWQGIASPIPTPSNAQDTTSNSTPPQCAQTKSVRSLSESLHAHNVGSALPADGLYYRMVAAARAVLSLVPARPTPGRLLWFSDATHGGPLAASARNRPASQFGCGSGIPTPWILERFWRAQASTGKSALRGNSTMRR